MKEIIERFGNIQKKLDLEISPNSDTNKNNLLTLYNNSSLIPRQIFLSFIRFFLFIANSNLITIKKKGKSRRVQLFPTARGTRLNNGGFFFTWFRQGEEGRK